jgi:hypothetical protein
MMQGEQRYVVSFDAFCAKRMNDNNRQPRKEYG